MEHNDADVLVVGGGHAGTEAALAAARRGAKVILVTHNRERIGEMSCNPAIGGIGKGHLVREIDALDGIMGRAADEASIQYRLLNRSRGPATWGPRAQADRSLYKASVQRALKTQPMIRIEEGEVTALHLVRGRAAGVVLADAAVIRAPAVILTAGTFLGARVHIGDESYSAGRLEDPAADQLEVQLKSLGLTMGRLKTGTPPRLNSRTIDWARLEWQAPDDEPFYLSSLTNRTYARQIPCGIAATTQRTHEIVRSNLHLSAMHLGSITGKGPRYCPSIEDKVTRFADKASHNIFLEPEGLVSDLVYPNGISNSLPRSVQQELVRSISGLEWAEIVQPGYAVEYGFIDPRALGQSLNVKGIDGLYLAGQINGSTGYEEAAAQGLIAGANAAAWVSQSDPLNLSRSDAYIGVLIDDLTSNGVTEPYRMFTSRSEYRLRLRPDNADDRLTVFGRSIGLVGDERWRQYEVSSDRVAEARKCAEQLLSEDQLAEVGVRPDPTGKKKAVCDLFGQSSISDAQLLSLCPDLKTFPASTLSKLRADAVYFPYMQRQEKEVDALRREEGQLLPADLDYSSVPGLSAELREKLAGLRPETLARAARIEGMTPAALALLLARVRRERHDAV